MEITSGAPGCRSLRRIITLYKDCHWLEITNFLNKEKEYEPEGVHFAFPFNLKNTRVLVDLPFSGYIAEKEQFQGSNKNYFTANRFIDLSNEKEGITLVSPDAPLYEIGKIGADATITGWFEEVSQNPVIYSYVMNNYWETNYAASQEGTAKFTYYLKPHAEYNSAEAIHFSSDRCMPLLFFGSGNSGPAVTSSLFNLLNDDIIVTGCKPAEQGDGIIVRLYNSSDVRQRCVVDLEGERLSSIYESDFNEAKHQRLSEEIIIDGKDFITIRIE